jgi:hypothetical protein
VSRAANYLDVDIRMPQQRGQSGHCGNFNGNKDDDRVELENFKNLVSEQEAFFVVPHYARSGSCSSGLHWSQLIAVTGGGAVAVDACAKACHAHNGVNAWTHFGVQSGMCHCAKANLNHGVTSWSGTCYSYEAKGNSKNLAACAEDTKTKARNFCITQMPHATASEVEACVFDSCFADPAMVMGDIDFSNKMDLGSVSSPSQPEASTTTTTQRCSGVEPNHFGVTEQHCQQCKAGYQWWPCDNSQLRALCCA